MALLKIVGHGKTSSVVVGWKEMKINVIVMQTCVIITLLKRYGVFRFHGNGLLKGHFYEILSKIILFSFTVDFSSDLRGK